MAPVPAHRRKDHFANHGGNSRPHAGRGPVRFLVLGDDKKVKTVIDLTRYGLVVP